MAKTRSSRFSRPPAAQRVLEVADELFYGEGIHTVGVDRIAADADTSKATLYAHYGSKDGLIAAYLDRRTSEAREGIAAQLSDADGDAKVRLLGLFDGLTAWHAEDAFRGCPCINASSELSDHDHPAFEVGRQHRTWVRERFAAIAEELGVADPGTAGVQLLMLYDAATVAAYVDGEPDAAAIARDAVERLLASWGA